MREIKCLILLERGGVAPPQALLYEIKMCPQTIDNKRDSGGGDGSRTRVRKCYWSRDYMLIPVYALGITQDVRDSCSERTRNSWTLA